VFERPADDQQRDRPDADRDREADPEAAQEEERVQDARSVQWRV
jgi:hypothetical protein